MITFSCPSCKATCSLGDEFAGRKMKCPKCRTRIRHHKDGRIEVLTMAEAPPPPAAPPAPAAGAAAAPAPAAQGAPAPETPKKGSTVDIPVVPEMVKKLVSQSESKQNTIVVGGVIGFLAIVLSGIGMLTKDLILTVAPLAVGFVTAFVWLMLRSRRRHAAAASALQAKDPRPTAPGDKTEALPKP